MKLDAKFEGEIRKAKDGTVVPGDEYVVFLAKDNVFAKIALPAYVQGCIEAKCDAEQIAAASAMLERVRWWRLNNPHRLKDPDAANEQLLDVSA